MGGLGWEPIFERETINSKLEPGLTGTSCNKLDSLFPPGNNALNMPVWLNEVIRATFSAVNGASEPVSKLLLIIKLLIPSFIPPQKKHN